MLPSNDFFSMVQDAYADEIEGVRSYSRMAQLAPTECLKRAILDICGDELRHASFFDTILCCSPMESIQPTPAPMPMPNVSGQAEDEGFTIDEIREATRGFFGTISTSLLVPFFWQPIQMEHLWAFLIIGLLGAKATSTRFQVGLSPVLAGKAGVKTEGFQNSPASVAYQAPAYELASAAVIIVGWVLTSRKSDPMIRLDQFAPSFVVRQRPVWVAASREEPSAGIARRLT